ncbi:hypothetical protein [Bacillus thermotolerans]|uniref:Lipoprotein n=1 Tax=Bacillus thermotolerans TaxID=1221996 RepID=A0A0F5HNN4_BACTR|nr:hypothetical protein [Bacillus thermotolerans]KKB34916.1 hypothetical protein QY97_02067 [Bacillus thermotolerans]KKB39995.1 hypothetical protein QY95_01867 [Bacillus thermotolerans]KKB43105.1 hypothetical protein QY96_00992 [Bacillus thermotolerans]
MKAFVLFISIVISTGVLAACGGEKKVEVESTVSNEEAVLAEKEEAPKSMLKEYNQPITDNKNVKATLVSIEKIVDPEWNEERVEVKFAVENKRKETIEVQAREVSTDGKMVDAGMLTMSQEVSPGKRADAILTIQNYDGDLPSMKDNLEMKLHIFSWDNMDYTEEHHVKINLK